MVIELRGTRRERVPLVDGRPPALARLAIVGTPRSGRSWIRSVLAAALGAQELPADHPADVEWARLPDRFVLQLAWPRSRFLERALRDRGIPVVSVARHPLDVLLRLAPPEVSGAAFVDWAVGEETRALLSLTPQWWSTPTTHRVRYEDLIVDPEAAFAALLGGLGLAAREPPLRTRKAARDGWREALSAEQVDALTDAHRDVMISLGYDPDDRVLA